tara:strand:+ start:978 stop:1352 length:375 start_codon:yes stop_codon:yes gene_type:complete
MEKRGVRSLKKDKKAIQLTLETILLLILMVVAVLVLATFFTQSSQGFFGRIKSYFVYSNVDSVIEGCNVLSGSESSYAFCCESKEVKYFEEGEKTVEVFNCSRLAEQSFINNKINKLDCKVINC